MMAQRQMRTMAPQITRRAPPIRRPISTVRKTVPPQSVQQRPIQNQNVQNPRPMVMRTPQSRMRNQPLNRMDPMNDQYNDQQYDQGLNEQYDDQQYDDQFYDDQNECYDDYANRINMEDDPNENYDEQPMNDKERKGRENSISKEIKERYQELIKDLWKNEQKLNEFDIPSDLKNTLNERVHLWLEYFLTNSTFRSGDNNMFEYLDTFNATTTFI